MDVAVIANDPVTSLRYHKNQYGHPNHSGNGLHLMMKDHIDELLELVKKASTLYQMILDFEKFLEANLLQLAAKFERIKKLTSPQTPGRHNRCEEISTKAQVEEFNEQPCTESDINLRMEKTKRTEKLPLHVVSLRRTINSKTHQQGVHCLNGKDETNHNLDQTKLKYKSNVRHGRKFVEERPRTNTLLKCLKILFLSIMFSSAVEGCSGYVHRAAAVGMHASFDCDIESKPNSRISSDENGALDFKRVKWKDAGAYDCREYTFNLEVTALVPFFQQTSLSYIQLRPEKYQHLFIEMSIQPHLIDGLILYIGNDIDESPVVTFGLQGAQPVMHIFKGNVSTAIKGKQLMSKNKWHTLSLKVDRKTATMAIDKFPPNVRTVVEDIDFSDCSMHIGALPNSSVPLNLSGLSAGFVGYISEFKHNDRLVDLGSEALYLVGIDHYNACAENPCRNCTPANVKEGFVCICPRNDTDTYCQIAQKECSHIMSANLEENVVITWKTTDRHITYVNVSNEYIGSCTPLLKTGSLDHYDFQLYNVSFSNDTCQLDINYPVLIKAFGIIKIEIESSTAGLESVFVNESKVICMSSSAAVVFISGEQGDVPKPFETPLHNYSLVIGIIVAIVFLLAVGITMFVFRGKVRFCKGESKEQHDGVQGNGSENNPLVHQAGRRQGTPS
ncbi:uncharacterized protein LOC128205347 isoform X2 [Mya arenaria]|uniref:uncharacterized protein LOC128205347 isoform X2 n=1 Tax=Mya arenaria TaxID=6604 RepID=UPI0022E64800|nr:uncharacterized protein LOC128205347 isoform X2 [Mya arenaria]